MQKLPLAVLALLAGCTVGGFEDDTSTGDDTAAAADADADGYDADEDCDDGNASVFPGADEVCNGIDDDCNGVPDDGIPSDGAGCHDPGLPDFGDTIGVLTVAVRTGDGFADGTNNNDLSVCLSETDCFEMDIPGVDDFRVGEMDVYHFEGIDLPRASVDRVQITSQNGSDRWVPACMEIQFDGEPVYCQDQMGMTFGNDGDELSEWTDPDGLHQACTTCYPTPLTHGPMIGAVGPTEARIWVRTDATRKTAVRVGRTSELGDPVAWVYPSPLTDYATVANIHGLEPATTWFYSVEVEGETSPIRTFRTAPADGPSSFRFAFGSCTLSGSQPIFSQVQTLDPDLFLFVGDSHYGNTDDLGALRWYNRWGLERPQRAALLARTPTLAVWDDHDFTGNNTDGTEPGKEVALRVFGDYWANPAAGTPDIPGIFFRQRFGDVDLFMLDDRYYRDLDWGMLGSDQTAWLEDELLASDATFKLLVTGSQWTPEGSNDSWAVFDDAREALFDFLRDEEIEGVVLLSGDVHRSEFRLIERQSDGGYDLPELTSSPLANINSICFGGDEVRDCFWDDDFFIVVDVDTTLADPTLWARIVDTDGDVRASWTILHSELEIPEID